MVFAEILHTLLFCIAIFLQLDTIGIWSEKCRHQQPATSNQQPATSKISQFWETHKVFRGIVKTIIFPWGIASIAKKFINHIKPKKLDERAVESVQSQVADSNNQRTNDTESSSSGKEVHKKPFAKTIIINSEITKIEKRYDLYAKNPQNETNKQDMIKDAKK